jgi:hypothetical protein
MLVLCSPLLGLSEDLDSGKSRKILSLASWYFASRSSRVMEARSLAGVAAADEPASSFEFSAPFSDVAFDGADELGAVLPPTEAFSPGCPIRRMIFIAGAFGGGVLLVIGWSNESGVGLKNHE